MEETMDMDGISSDNNYCNMLLPNGKRIIYLVNKTKLLCK